jgi:hypothetical protein
LKRIDFVQEKHENFRFTGLEFTALPSSLPKFLLKTFLPKLSYLLR